MGNYIYIFTNSYKPVLGGIQTVTSQVAETLKKRGEKVVVVTQMNRKALAPLSTICDVPVFRFHFGFSITFVFLWLLFFVRQPKAVYIHFPLDQASLVHRLKKHFDFKLVTCFHGHDVLRYYEGTPKSGKTYSDQRNLVYASDRVTACSGYLAKAVDDVFGYNHTIVVYNGVDLSRYNAKTTTPIPSSLYIFAFGRLEKIKGFDMLISAFGKLDCDKDLSLLIAGEGSQRNELEKQIVDSELSDRVKLIGRKTPEEIVQLTQNACVIVVSSHREPFGIVVLEGIAAKRPVVATKAGGIPEIMDIRFGELVPPSVNGLVEGIEKALSRNDYQFDYVEDYLKGFTIDEMVDNYLKLLR